MRLERPLAAIDVETTGIDPAASRILEIGVVVLSPNGDRKPWSQRFNPGMPIPAEATAIHGITDADVKDCPPFSEWATRISLALAGKDIIGYSLWRLDLPIIDEELRRCGLKLDLTGVQVIDCYGIFSNKEGRHLVDAVRKFCGREHADAHGALADATATVDVLMGQLEAYPDLKDMGLPALAAFSKPGGDREMVDLAGKLYRDKDGYVRYTIGKARDVRVADDPGFGQWMIDRDFPGSTKEALAAEFERLWPTSGSTDREF
jgi:DNA polymerase-3 subunit epsilon